ncbi:hypothetical protein [Lentibacillus juripiscarius]|uniref:Uncharacterized protein n=1 Tax=Lentibacillus juripiscarius TaxID=257446 RepID=A0ABW5V5Z2_9BACI
MWNINLSGHVINRNAARINRGREISTGMRQESTGVGKYRPLWSKNQPE